MTHLNNRMPAGFDGDGPAGVELGPHEPVAHRYLSQAGKQVNPGNGGSSIAYGVGGRADLVTNQAVDGPL